ncbi:MAG: type II secretion system protein GspF, partial [Actinobacteria bacterium]|nr:type II secretion system protein GspF [Actinomycetota bacterium]
MATYNYTVRSSKGEIIKDSIDGEAEDSVISKLKDMGYFIVNITKLKEDKVKRKLPALKIFTRVKTRDIVVFTRQFATMIAAGMSLMESLIILGKQT